MSKAFPIILRLLTVLVVAACTGTGEQKEDAPSVVEEESAVLVDAPKEVASTTALPADNAAVTVVDSGQEDCGDSCSYPQTAIENKSGPLSQKAVYFDFDGVAIRNQDNELLRQHARYLSQHAAVTLRLEGHADERGSREYNIALGDRRAQAVRRFLLLHGAAEAQLSSVSFGEELPAVSGTGEHVWQQNRRVELIYQRPTP